MIVKTRQKKLCLGLVLALSSGSLMADELKLMTMMLMGSQVAIYATYFGLLSSFAGSGTYDAVGKMNEDDRRKKDAEILRRTKNYSR